MMGLHPTSVQADYAADLKKVESCFGKRTYCAVGEIGIDLYWDKTYRTQQIEVFEEQLRWSLDLDLPVAIHTREAFPDVFDSIYKVGADKLKGVFHSFVGQPKIWKPLRNFPDSRSESTEWLHSRIRSWEKYFRQQIFHRLSWKPMLLIWLRCHSEGKGMNRFIFGNGREIGTNLSNNRRKRGFTDSNQCDCPV